MATNSHSLPDPSRFQVSKRVLWVDRFMNSFIKVGGFGVIAAIFCIFLFILWQIIPLFLGAETKLAGKIDFGRNDFEIFGIDEWGELPFVAGTNGVFYFADLQREATVDDKHATRTYNVQSGNIALGERGIFQKEIFTGEIYQSVHFDPGPGLVIYSNTNGQVRLTKIDYSPVFKEDSSREIDVQIETEPPYQLGTHGQAIVDIDVLETAEKRIIATVQKTENGTNEVNLLFFKAAGGLFDDGGVSPEGYVLIRDTIPGNPVRVLINGAGDSLIVADDNDRLHYLRREADDNISSEPSGGGLLGELGGEAAHDVVDPVQAPYQFVHKQTFDPLESYPDTKIASLHWLFGRGSLVLTGSKGEQLILSSYSKAEGGLTYAQINQFPSLKSGAELFDYSRRNRAFLVTNGSEVQLQFATTGTTRWQTDLGYTPKLAGFGPKYDLLLFANERGSLDIHYLDDPHPEAGWKAFFGKIWYEGQPEPKYTWQSTGGESSFEPKLSMVPLIVGSLKGTLYALMFAVPISILAALYSSQFLSRRWSKVIKPTMEIMASLPSVVLGFLAALWLAPILETKVPSIILIILMIPGISLLFGYSWSRLPKNTRAILPEGSEFWVLIPIMAIATWVGWTLGPILEQILFGGDFRQWWPKVTGTPFEQRNSLVVGFMMGFAVIPIIFTIAEDAMSNVPIYLRSAALALGASRWQTAWRVVLPTAAAGIFAAVMIGFGRAVGETMIVVMATGNTPIMEWNIFSGMRTLAANIAVELPEAPQHSTLYRALFLGAMLLFILTFTINTVAEVIRQHLRNKFKAVSD